MGERVEGVNFNILDFLRSLLNLISEVLLEILDFDFKYLEEEEGENVEVAGCTREENELTSVSELLLDLGVR